MLIQKSIAYVLDARVLVATFCVQHATFVRLNGNHIISILGFYPAHYANDFVIRWCWMWWGYCFCSLIYFCTLGRFWSNGLKQFAKLPRMSIKTDTCTKSKTNSSRNRQNMLTDGFFMWLNLVFNHLKKKTSCNSRLIDV